MLVRFDRQRAIAMKEVKVSTVIDVYPSSAHVPTFKQFADAVQAVLIEHRADPHLAEIISGVSDAELRPRIERVMEMPGGKRWARFDNETETLDFRGDDYGWLSFPVIEYAFDFYFDDDVNEFEDLPHTAVIAEHAERAALIGSLQGFPFEKTAQIEHCWFLRMQAAQPLKTRILAGYVAVALARLTEGFLYSDDGGIDYDRAPADPATFLSWYPEWITHDMLGPSTDDPSMK